MKKLFNKKGFTLIELLVVIAIIAALAVVVFAAINPGKRIRDAQQQARLASAQAMLDALHTYIVDSLGNLPAVLTTTSGTFTAWNQTTGLGNAVQIGTGNSCTLSSVSPTAIGILNSATGGCSAGVATCVDLANSSNGIASYLSTNPVDPAGGLTSQTGYQMSMANGIITVKNCYNGNNPVISVSR